MANLIFKEKLKKYNKQYANKHGNRGKQMNPNQNTKGKGGQK